MNEQTIEIILAYMKAMSILILFCLAFLFSRASDTLYFRLSNPWNTVKDENGQYLRKAIHTKDSGWLTLDYNQANILVARSYYADTLFKTKLFCHFYYDETNGFLRVKNCYKNGQLDGLRVGFNEKGDTTFTETYNESVWMGSKNYPGFAGNGQQTFVHVEIESEFPGGNKAWYKYLSDNFNYPRAAVRKKIQGTVVVQFIVDKEGKVTEVAIAQSVDPILDEEAMRLIRNSPDWRPAIQDGKKVKSYKKQPIVFSLEKR